MKRLTDEELTKLALAVLNNSPIGRLDNELSPMPKNLVAPHVVVQRGHGAEDMVVVPWQDRPLFHDEAIGIGAALIRAALEDRGESK